MEQLPIDEFVASLRENMLIKLNYDPNDCNGILYKIGRIVCLYNHSPHDYFVMMVCWLAVKTRDDVYEPRYTLLDLILLHEIPRLQIMTENDLPELTLLALAVF